jgi:hypothetical protein
LRMKSKIVMIFHAEIVDALNNLTFYPGLVSTTR